MSIARFAQDKFDYQDLVTLRFLLTDVDRPGLGIRPEPDGGEDTEVSATINGVPIVFDIQAKDELASLDLGRLAYHLAHPTPRRTDETLFDKMLAAPDRVAVFVTSGRLTDDAVVYAAPDAWFGEVAARSAPTQKQAAAFLTAFGAVDLPPSRYERERKDHRNRLATSTDRKAAQTALGRVMVIERLSGLTLRRQCLSEIARYIRAPEVVAEAALTGLIGLVRAAKRSGVDIVPEARRLLLGHRRSPFGSPDYQARGDEAAWIDRLEREGTLLLGGPPRCGKSEAAEQIANVFLGKGFEVVRADDANDARRHLLDDGAVPKLVLLDDPLGDGWSLDDVPGAYEGLKRLIQRASPSRLLLVAQNQTPLFEAANVASLDALATAGRNWLDLGCPDPGFSEKVWRRHAGAATVPAAAVERLAKALAERTVRLEAGVLQHLAFSGKVEAATTLSEMLAIADEDASGFGRRIAHADPVTGRVLAAFGMGTDPTTGLDPVTLGFIVDGAQGAAPGKVRNLVRLMGRSDAGSERVAPTYREAPKLSAGASASVEMLENRRILTTDERGHLQLSHGYYRAAALGLLRRPASATADRHLALFKRALFSLSPRVSRAAARNLPRVYAALPDTSRSALIALARDGLTSVFPGTRDLCWRFLIERFDALPRGVQQDLPQWLNNAYSTELDDIEWHEGEAWIATERFAPGEWRSFRTVSKASVEAFLAGLEGDADYVVTAERADRALSYYARKPRRLNRAAMMRLLSMDEAALRGEASRIWLSVQRKADAQILDRMFEERHPRVALDAFHGVADAWPALTPKRRRELAQRFAAFIASPTVALPLLDTLVLMNRQEHFGEIPPWDLFAALLPTVLEQLTDRASGAEPRLFVAVRDAIPHLQPNLVVDICRAWIGWLTRTTREQLRSDHAWGVIDILIEATRHSPSLRTGLIDPLFAHVEETGAAAMLVRELTAEWDDLTISEREALQALLRRRRKDAPWLKAIVLTRADPPPALQTLILGAALPDEPDQVEQSMPADLFRACVEVHLGAEPFGFMGLSSWDVDPWPAVVNGLASQSDHPLGRMCLRSLIRTEATSRVLPVLRAWIDRLDEVFDLLLRHHAGTAGGPELKPCWEWVFAAASPEQLIAWDGRIADVAHGLVDTVFAFKKDFGVEVEDLPQTAAALKFDIQAIRLTHTIAEAEATLPGTAVKALPLILKMVTTAPPTLFGTFDYITRRLKTPALKDDPHWKEIAAERAKTFEPRKAQRLDLKFPDLEVDRSAWRGPI